MKKIIITAILGLSLASPSQVFAQTFTVTGPDPVETFTVCNHPALYAINNRARLVKHGRKQFNDLGSTATITYVPPIFEQSERLVRPSYRSLSRSGNCY